MSPIAASSAAAVTKLTPGRVSSRRISVEASTCSASARSISAISPSRNVDLAQAGRDRLLLIGRQLLRGEPAPTADAEQIAHRRLALQVADQRRVHLVLRACALPDQLRPRRDPAAQDPRLLIRQPDRRQKAAGEQLRQRARVDLVRLRARPRDPLDRLRIREHHPAHVRLDDPRDPERVPGRLQRNLIVTAEALREQLKRRRLGLHPPRQPHLASLRDRHLAEVAMHVQPDEPHPTPPPSRSSTTETRRATRQLRIRARGTPGQSQGRPPTNSGLAAHNVSTACPTCVSLKPLASGTRRRYATSRTTQKLHPRSFIPYNEHRPHRALAATSTRAARRETDRQVTDLDQSPPRPTRRSDPTGINSPRSHDAV